MPTITLAQPNCISDLNPNPHPKSNLIMTPKPNATLARTLTLYLIRRLVSALSLTRQEARGKQRIYQAWIYRGVRSAAQLVKK